MRFVEEVGGIPAQNLEKVAEDAGVLVTCLPKSTDVQAR